MVLQCCRILWYLMTSKCRCFSEVLACIDTWQSWQLYRSEEKTVCCPPFRCASEGNVRTFLFFVVKWNGSKVSLQCICCLRCLPLFTQLTLPRGSLVNQTPEVNRRHHRTRMLEPAMGPSPWAVLGLTCCAILCLGVISTDWQRLTLGSRECEPPKSGKHPTLLNCRGSDSYQQLFDFPA